MTDDELKQQFATLLARINDSHEAVLDRMAAVETDLRNLRSENAATRRLLTDLPATVVGAMEDALLSRMADLEIRTDRLERKGSS